MNVKEENNKVLLELSNEEALVLFDWLAKFNDNESNEFEDQAEERVLFDLESTLETVLNFTFKKDYKKILKEARDLLRDEE